MAFRQVDSGAVDENVFVDDRCATVWEAPRLSSSRTFASRPEPRKDVEIVAAETKRDAALLSTKVKPIEGNLLRKLFKATVEEKQRAAQAVAAARPSSTNKVAREKVVKNVEPPGFKLPPGVGTSRPRMQRVPDVKPQETLPQPAVSATSAANKEAPVVDQPSQPTISTRKRETPVLATPKSDYSPLKRETLAVKPSPRSGKSTPKEVELVRHSGSLRKEAAVEATVAPLSVAGVDDAVAALPAIDVAEPTVPVTAEIPAGKKKKNKKQERKNKKALAREQKQLAKGAGIIITRDIAHGELEKTDLHNDDALMLGALPCISVAGSGKSVRSNESIGESKPLHTVSNEHRGKIQTTAEAEVSRSPSRASRDFKAASTRPPSIHTTPTKLSSFISFEEIGEAWIGPAVSQHRSAHSSGPRSAPMNFPGEKSEELGELNDTEQRSRHSTPARISSIQSYRSPSPAVNSELANKSEEMGRSQSHGQKGRSIHGSFHSGSNKSSVKASQTFADATPKIHSGNNSPRQTSRISSPRHESRHGGSRDSIQGTSVLPSLPNPGSSQGRRPNTSGSHAGESPAGGEEARGAQANLDSPMCTVGGSGHSPRAITQPDSERSSIRSEHSKGISRSSQQHHQHSRHASTRSFSPRDDVWQEPSSTKSSAKRSRLSQSTDHGSLPKKSTNKPSRLTSVIGSVASMISRVRSELTFEELGEGWHDGGVPSDELERKILEAHRSTTRESTLHSMSDNQGEGRADRVEHHHSHQSQSRFNVHSHHSSRRTSDRSHHPSKHSDAQSSGNSSHRSRSDMPLHSLVGAPVYAVLSSEGQGSGVISSFEDESFHPQDAIKLRGQRPTVFAGKGWITPHPLESSVTERTPAIVVPSDAIPNGATLSYEEWKAIQEGGLRNHRNFSVTESDESGGKRHKDDRYQFSGWEAQSWQEVEPPTLDPNAASARVTSSHEAAKAQSVQIESVSERSAEQRSQHSHGSSRDRSSKLSPSERAWERMEEGNALHGSHRGDSVLSGTASGRAYSVWNQSDSRSGSRR
ncbi:uncharacterized protein RCC_07649 [Ramularia collo-cygni]|uniref:Uncharacterized protein n=1 Tax=Ramularia collo-cygni TaxID=112498 RepID=A0A2D3VFV7_9PEZI|nr:uncharacterized protein RCC_07649 [Ramularia collo-cygni]CZT21784.1 uncharacterized protein RCC_07649 [Ramularia collo-cygni]